MGDLGDIFLDHDGIQVVSDVHLEGVWVDLGLVGDLRGLLAWLLDGSYDLRVCYLGRRLNDLWSQHRVHWRDYRVNELRLNWLVWLRWLSWRHRRYRLRPLLCLVSEPFLRKLGEDILSWELVEGI